MHFWIDKRSQTCGFSGRHRVPASLSAGCGQQRRRRRSRDKPMVTPVHRFQPVECVQQGSAQQAARRQQQHHRQLHSCLPPAYSNGLTSPPGASVRSIGPHAVELDSSVFLDLPLDGSGNDNVAHNAPQPQLLPVGRLKCGMWASFALATVFVAGAKFYFDHQGTGLEVLVFCALLIVFLLAACTVSLCRSKATRDLLAAAVTSQAPHSTVSSQQGQGHSTDQLEVVSTEDIGLNQIINQPNPLIFSPVAGPPQSPVTAPEPPPPPYHIAILLPQQTHSNNQTMQANEESPPPSYDKVVS
ncbi:hypothetical protein R5R35_009891 [Gryllus longicercus]|uniref:Uncharacterized protein n=1 Tax=Gryllus longicercus TaxID=2509291 RepID=A0AAN9VYY0_9ORTH